MAVLLLALLAGGAASADCRNDRGRIIALVGSIDDPDVLMWDSRDRLIDYAAGSSDTRRFLLPHALLVRAGTRVKISNCIPNVVHPKYYFGSLDAVGVEIASGRFRGRYGWVASSDLEGFRPPAASQPW